MKFKLVFFICLFSSSICNSQDITLRILGNSNYIEYAESNVVIISINISESKKIKTLKDSLTKHEFNNKPIKIDDYKNLKSIKYKIEDKDINVFDKILILCSNLQIRVDKIYFKMPEYIIEDEDKKAISALKNANSQAKIIANHLGYKIDKILNIDDDTSFYNTNYDDFKFDNVNENSLLRILYLLGSDYIYDTESSTPTEKEGYNLWITYKLKKK